jgi:hypothetical protein
MADETDHDDPLLTDLYREGATEQPPATLDSTIRGAARRELAMLPWYRRTAVRGYATAAVLMIAIGLVVLQPGTREQAVTSPQATDAGSVRMDMPSTPAIPTPPLEAAPRQAPIEEIIVTGSRMQQAFPVLEPEPVLEEGTLAPGAQPAQDLIAAPETIVRSARRMAPATATRVINGYVLTVNEHDKRLHAPGCGEDYTLTADALISSNDVGLLVNFGEGGYALRCSDGRWLKAPLPKAPLPHELD